VAKGEASRKRIVAAAADQASVRGLSAVSLQDVAEAVGLSKSGVFKHFDSKEALQAAVVESVLTRFVDHVWRPAQDLPPGAPRLRQILERWLDWVDDGASGGCPITPFVVELDDQPGPLLDNLRWQQSLWNKTLRNEFRALRDPPVDKAVATQAAFELLSLTLGYHHRHRLLRDAEARAMTLRGAEALIERTAASA
jgi:AcrR family transcriptional regulator